VVLAYRPILAIRLDAAGQVVIGSVETPATPAVIQSNPG
jgi:hypothetical protein